MDFCFVKMLDSTPPLGEIQTIRLCSVNESKLTGYVRGMREVEVIARADADTN